MVIISFIRMNALLAGIPGGLLSGDRDRAGHRGDLGPADLRGDLANPLTVPADLLTDRADLLTVPADLLMVLGAPDLIKNKNYSYYVLTALYASDSFDS